MDDHIEVYEHALVTARAKQALCVLLTAFALVIGLWSVPAHAADGVVTGTVTDAEGDPLPGVGVVVWWLHNTSSPHFDAVEFDETDANGDYAIDAPSGTVRVQFYGDTEHAGEWFDDAASLEEATDLTLASSGSVSADAALAEYGRLDGNVDGQPGDPLTNSVVLLDPETGAVRDRTSIDASGDYSFDQVAPGSYRVSFNRLSGFAFSAAQFWDDKAEHLGLGAADVVTVDPGTTVGDVDATLVEGGHITGSLTDGAGIPLTCRVQAFTSDKTLVTRSVTSDADGSFDISGLSTGSYLVRVVSSGACQNGTQYRTDGGGPLAGSVGQADPVAVTLGGTASVGAALVYQSPTLHNTYPPAVYNQPLVGSPLGATVGSWSRSPSGYAYAWLADGVPIPGATAGAYVPVAADVGKLISVRVQASRSGYQSGTATSAAVGPVTWPPIVNTILPKVKAPARVGGYTRAWSGAWSATDLSYSYTWQTGTTVLATTTTKRFRVPPKALARGLFVTVTVSKPGYPPGSATSAVTPVEIGRFKIRGKLLVKGAARVGSTLRVSAKVSPEPDRVFYTWQRDGRTIGGARSATYTLTAADVGARITVRVRYTGKGMKNKWVTSGPTPVVQR